MASRNPILLLIDPSPLTRAALMDQFGYYDFSRILEAASLEEGLACAKTGQPDLLLLHPPWPDMSGEGALVALREAGLEMPVMVIGDLRSGGTEHVANMVKPLRFSGLVSRIRALIGAFEHNENTVLSFGQFRFFPASHILESCEGEKIPVTEMEAGILRYLHKADGKVVSREELLSEIWGYNPNVRTHTLATHIHRLRQKIERDPSHPLILLTQKNGYALLRSPFPE